MRQRMEKVTRALSVINFSLVFVKKKHENRQNKSAGYRQSTSHTMPWTCHAHACNTDNSTDLNGQGLKSFFLFLNATGHLILSTSQGLNRGRANNFLQPKWRLIRLFCGHDRMRLTAPFYLEWKFFKIISVYDRDWNIAHKIAPDKLHFWNQYWTVLSGSTEQLAHYYQHFIQSVAHISE